MRLQAVPCLLVAVYLFIIIICIYLSSIYLSSIYVSIYLPAYLPTYAPVWRARYLVTMAEDTSILSSELVRAITFPIGFWSLVGHFPPNPYFPPSFRALNSFISSILFSFQNFAIPFGFLFTLKQMSLILIFICMHTWILIIFTTHHSSSFFWNTSYFQQIFFWLSWIHCVWSTKFS